MMPHKRPDPEVPAEPDMKMNVEQARRGVTGACGEASNLLFVWHFDLSAWFPAKHTGSRTQC